LPAIIAADFAPRRLIANACQDAPIMPHFADAAFSIFIFDYAAAIISPMRQILMRARTLRARARFERRSDAHCAAMPRLL